MSNLLNEFVAVDTEIKRLEKRMIVLKVAMKDEFPEPGRFGLYNVKWGRQDRRKIDRDLVTALALSKKAPSEMFRPMLVMDEIPKLVESGVFTKEDLVACLVGPVVKFPQVELAKDDSQEP